MIKITLKLTLSELEALNSLASDQLFRREFIDPRMPGHRANPGELTLGKQLVERMKATLDKAKGIPMSRSAGITV